MFTKDTLMVFSELLDQVQIPSTHPDLINAAIRVSKARKELVEAIQQCETKEDNDELKEADETNHSI